MAIKTRGLGLKVLRFLKRLFIFLFFFQLFYIFLLKWVDPPITLTQLRKLDHRKWIEKRLWWMQKK